MLGIKNGRRPQLDNTPWRRGSSGAERSGACICGFSSTQNTAACWGGLRYSPLHSLVASDQMQSCPRFVPRFTETVRPYDVRRLRREELRELLQAVPEGVSVKINDLSQ